MEEIEYRAIDAHWVGLKHRSCSLNYLQVTWKCDNTCVSSETAMLTRRYGDFQLCPGSCYGFEEVVENQWLRLNISDETILDSNREPILANASISDAQSICLMG